MNDQTEINLRTTLNTGAFALAFLTGGTLADLLFEPRTAPGGALAGSVGQLSGKIKMIGRVALSSPRDTDALILRYAPQS